MLTIKEYNEFEIIINKSRFISSVFRLDDISDLENNIKILKEKYKDATHYCYAYIIDNYKRFNDDGEPSGTAGKPILDVLEKNNLNHVLCVVTRYFGGILLGAGGLVRAYSKSTSECIKNSKIINIEKGKNVTLIFNYDMESIINSIIKKENVCSKDYTDKIKYNVNVTEEQLEKIKSLNNIDIDILSDTFVDF